MPERRQVLVKWTGALAKDNVIALEMDKRQEQSGACFVTGLGTVQRKLKGFLTLIHKSVLEK